MRLLNDLLNMHDGFNDDEWMKECRKRMIDSFPREDPFSILAPPGFDIDQVYDDKSYKFLWLRFCIFYDT